MNHKRLSGLILASSLMFSGCTQEPPDGGSFLADATTVTSESDPETTPYGRYEETVTYQLAKMTGLNNMPEGDTYEDNAYTRLLRDKLNIQNVDVLEAADNAYESAVEMYVAGDELPDVFVVSSLDQLKYLTENDMIADLSEAYEYCTTDTIKEIYASYGDEILSSVTFDGKIMAVPGTNISNGPNLIWLRKDWMDQLGLEDPESLDDVMNIVRAFQSEDPGKNGEGNTLGLVINTDIAGTSGYSILYSLDTVFSLYGAYPKQWIEKDGEIVYGSWTEEAKTALEYINGLYEEGLIDPDFSLRTMNNIHDVVVSGQCGAFFGPWWSGNNPLTEAVKQDPDADWKCYLIGEQDGSVTFYSGEPSSLYVVVRKGYEHPEIVFKIISVLFDYARFGDCNNEEISWYDQNNVDQTARPLVINVDYCEALLNSHANIQKVIEGETTLEDVPALDASYARACQNYLKDPENSTAEDWAAYVTRIEALELIEQADLNRCSSLYYGQTETMAYESWKLSELESDAYLRIITGEDDISMFEEYKKQWLEQGGEQIIQEIEQELEKSGS